MKLLLDTHTLLWSLLEPGKLSESARAALIQADNQVWVSAISFWEIALKTALGKMTLQGATPETLVDAALHQGFELLPLEPRLAAGFAKLPNTAQHRDPFDRMLMWQALSLGLTLVSRDRKIGENAPAGLQLLW
jgi:PIN domain nuclease of toxin-antitoxin system